MCRLLVIHLALGLALGCGQPSTPSGLPPSGPVAAAAAVDAAMLPPSGPPPGPVAAAAVDAGVLPPFTDRCVSDSECMASPWVPGHCCTACQRGATRSWDQAMSSACAGRPSERADGCYPCQFGFGGPGHCVKGRCASPDFSHRVP